MSDTLSTKSVSSKAIHSPLWHGRIPATVAVDPKISAEALRVYALIALSVFQGRVARVGMRQLGKVIGCGAMTIRRRIDELVKAGHVEVLTPKRGQRAYYSLTSPVFGQKQGKENVVVSSPKGSRLVSVEKRRA